MNKNNQLLIKPLKKTKPVVANGKFSVDESNRLNYWLNEPASWRREYDLANKISFIGNWSLNPNYDLELKLDETKEQYGGDKVVLKGGIISTDEDALVFEISSLDKQGQSHIQLFKLSGFWQADEFNRLSFLVKKKDAPDILTLEGNWQINQNQQITYSYEKTDFKTKTRRFYTLTFDGFWQINAQNRLSYILSRSFNSYFDFRAQIESPNLYPKEGIIKYRLGVGLRKDKPSQTKIISLYGTWKFSRRAGLTFQMHYGKGKIHSIEFATDIHLNKKDEITFSLTDKRNAPLGMGITFTHRFLKKYAAETFLRLKKYKEESGVETGIRIPF